MHLDMPFTVLGAANGRSDARRQDLKDTFARIIDLAREEAVDLLFICGDLYEHNYVKKSTINFINDKFSQIPRTQVFIVPGNHDPYINDSYYKNFLWSGNVHILNEDNSCVALEDLKTCVYGIGFKSFFEDRPRVYDLKPNDADYINILLAHGSVDMNVGRSRHNPMSSSNLSELGMDYIALGHFHNTIERLGGRSNIFNPGSPEPLGFDEAGDHGVLLGTVSKDDNRTCCIEASFIKTSGRSYRQLDIDAGGLITDERLIEKIRDTIGHDGVSKDLFNISLKGYVDKGFKPNTGYIEEFFSGRVFYIRVKDETLPDYDFEEIQKEPGLKGLYTRKLCSLINGTEDEYQKRLLLRALYYGIEALELGKVDA